jgi:hypothetical protein
MTVLLVVLLVALGFPLAALAGVIVSGRYAWRRFARASGAFRCKVRVTKGEVPGVRRQFPRRPGYARWVHDVLLVHQDALRPYPVPVPARFPDGVMHGVSRSSVPGLGDAPLVLPVQLDDGPIVEVAAAQSDRTLLVGPFLAAAMDGLPRLRTDRP